MTCPRKSRMTDLAVERAVTRGGIVVVAYPGYLHIHTPTETRIERVRITGRTSVSPLIILDEWSQS